MFWLIFFFFSSRRRHTRLVSDWSSDVCSSDLALEVRRERGHRRGQPDRGAHAEGDRGADRKSVVKGKSVDLGGRRIIKKKKKKKINNKHITKIKNIQNQ